MTALHVGTLRESSYNFYAWVTCTCGWRSRSYPKASAAWKAHQVHVDATVTVGGEQ